jgi:rhomboid-like protein
VQAGLFSSLAAHIASVRLHLPRIAARLARNTPTKPSVLSRVFPTRPANIKLRDVSLKGPRDATPGSVGDRSLQVLPSLGSAGAIYACATLTALALPRAPVPEVDEVAMPAHASRLPMGMVGLVAFDVVGAMCGWTCVFLVKR